MGRVGEGGVKGWAGGNLRALLVGLREEEEERRGLSRPALPENAIALPLERVVLGWVRFPGLKNVSRVDPFLLPVHSVQETSEGSGRGWRGEGSRRAPRLQTHFGCSGVAHLGLLC